MDTIIFINGLFNADTFCRFLTFSIFVLAGYDLSKSTPIPRSPFAWLMLALVIGITGYVGMSVNLVTVLGYTVHVNDIIFGLTSGFVAGIVLRARPNFKTR